MQSLDEEIKIKQQIYKSCGFKLSNYKAEAESIDYSACDFELNNLKIKYRQAKTTPTKSGQFVTLWKRIGKGPIMPFDIRDKIDFYIISVSSKVKSGYFIFSKEILKQQNILSVKNIGGRRAMRVYPPWVKVTSVQALKSQKWQSQFFTEIVNKKCVLKLLS